MIRKACTTPAPVTAGDWIAEAPDTTHPDIAKVKSVYWDNIAGEWVADIVIYDHQGDRIGRKSPAMGGPKHIEPCVPMGNWRRIAKPEFPLSTDMTGHRDWGPHLKYLPDEQANSHGAGDRA